MPWSIAIIEEAPMTECAIRGHRYLASDLRMCCRCGHQDTGFVRDIGEWWGIFDTVAWLLAEAR